MRTATIYVSDSHTSTSASGTTSPPPGFAYCLTRKKVCAKRGGPSSGGTVCVQRFTSAECAHAHSRWACAPACSLAVHMRSFHCACSLTMCMRSLNCTRKLIASMPCLLCECTLAACIWSPSIAHARTLAARMSSLYCASGLRHRRLLTPAPASESWHRNRHQHRHRVGT